MLNKVSPSLAALIATFGLSASSLISAATRLGRDDKTPRVKHVHGTVVPYGKQASNPYKNRLRKAKRLVGNRQIRRYGVERALARAGVSL